MDMEKCGSASTFHFRLKLLQASAAMQAALGITDLGRLYYKTIRNEDNSVVVISTVNYLRSTKSISSLSVRWIPLAKINNRKSTNNIFDILIKSAQDQILFHQVSNMPVGPGLYLGYLMLASSVDVLKILVTGKCPNMVPHTKIRDDPHVSKEESVFLQNLVLKKVGGANAELGQNAKEQDSCTAIQNGSKQESASPIDQVGKDFQDDTFSSVHNSSKLNCLQSQRLFRGQIITGLKRLFSFMEIDAESSKYHRLYQTAVIEVNSSVSLLIVVPPIERICIPAGQSDLLLQRKDLIALPVQIFEMLHMSTYQNEFFNRFSRLSAMMEISTVVAQHHQREFYMPSRELVPEDLRMTDCCTMSKAHAFSTIEMAEARKHLSQLQDVQKRLDSTWKGSRWIIDVVTISRDKSVALASVATLLDTVIESKLMKSPLVHTRTSEKRSNSLLCNNQSQVPNPNVHVERRISDFDGPPPSFSSISNLTLKPFHLYYSDHDKAAHVPPQIGDENRFLIKPGFASIHSSQSQCDVSNFIFTEAKSADRMLSSSLHDLYSDGRTHEYNSLLRAGFINPVSCGSSSKGRTIIPEVVSAPIPPPVPPRRPSISTKPESVCQLNVSYPLELPVLPQSSGVSPSFDLTNPTIYKSEVFTATQESLSSPPSTIIQVFAAYDCGLSAGTSVKIQISSQTTARQVVDLLVKQLNAQVKTKGLQSPVYEQTKEFCLVSVVGARERCLRNDFNPLLLQNPWKNGCMYVRKRNDVTAAIEMNSCDREYR